MHFKEGPTLVQQAQAGVEYAIREVEKAPQLEWRFLWSAYTELANEKQIVVGDKGAVPVGGIPPTALHAYADWYNLTDQEAEDFKWIIGRLDAFVTAGKPLPKDS